jgi:putative FmdB family regulatory protein
MPIYEYRCGTCGDEVEVLVRSSATTPLCPDCGNPLTDKLLSAFNVMSERARRPAGHTCCGREERCGTPHCAEEGGCRHE